MLDDYKEVQAVAYDIMINEIKNNQINHAYLIDENNNNAAFSFAMAFIKEILCSDLSMNDAVSLRKRIDDGNYPEIKIIEPDGMLIKKQQILDLQEEFSKVAIEGKKRFYIIKDADKMRSETANSMLKFLEEPDNDIVAILLTNNFNNMLSTIISRCQIIRLNGDNSVNMDNFDIQEIAYKFLVDLEKFELKTIVDEQDLVLSKISSKDREKYAIFFDKLIDMYYDIFKISNGDFNIVYREYFDSFKQIAEKRNIQNVLEKINYLIIAKDRIKNNVNINLLIDAVIVKFGGIK